MKPFFHEFKRVFTSKTVLVFLIIIVLFSSLSAYSSAQSSTTTSQAIGDAVSYGYGSNDTYHIFILLENKENLPSMDTKVNLTIANGTSFYEYSNSQGFANFTLSNLTPSQISFHPKGYVIPTANNEVNVAYSATINESSYQDTFSSSVSVYLNQSSPYFFTTYVSTKLQNGTIANQTVENGRYSISSTRIPGEPTRRQLSIWYEGNQGTVSPDIKLYYGKLNSIKNGYNTSSLTETNFTYYGTYSSFSQKTINPSNLTSTNSSWYVFALFTPGGKLLALDPIQIYYPTSVSQVNTQFFGTEMTIVGLFVPLMAVTSGYLTFGKERASGALKSTLVRPVTRIGVISSRYLSNVTAIFIASVVAFLVSSLVFNDLLGVGLPMDTIYYGLFTILISIAAYTGVIYLASSILRSQGSILAAAIGTFIVLDFLWSSLLLPVIPFAIIIGVFRAVPGSIEFARGYFTLFYFSPSGYTNIASYIITNQNPIYTTGNVTGAQLGVTPLKYVLGGILWIIIPAALAVAAFIKRD